MGRGVLVAQGNHSLPNSSVPRIYRMHVMLERIQNILLTCVPDFLLPPSSVSCYQEKDSQQNHVSCIIAEVISCSR